VVSACEQSGRARVPEVKTPVSLADWAAKADQSQRLVLDPLATLKLSAMKIDNDTLSLLVGPEGGLSTEELKSLDEQAVVAVSLGRRILRSESAGPAAIAVLQAAAGDL